ncbi:hypothetical protein LCGC14_0476060 [marine sediment metagenome]|uniref:Uncharacterized protein n=1 Tax=marine sediment metagenome TaxID=412755 RepID=A0A0F9SG33_9ZZZZ
MINIEMVDGRLTLIGNGTPVVIGKSVPPDFVVSEIFNEAVVDCVKDFHFKFPGTITGDTNEI